MSRNTFLNIEVDQATLDLVESKLDSISKRPKTVLRKAYGNSARKVQRMLSAQAVKVYRYATGVSGIRASMRIYTTSEPAARIQYISPVKEPRDYYLEGGITYKYKRQGEKSKRVRIKEGAAGALFRSGDGVMGAVLQSGAPKIFQGATGKAFIVKFKSGHVAVVTRDPNETAKKFRGKKLTKHTQKLRTWRSPSVPTMIGNAKVIGALEDDIRAEIHEQTRLVIERLVNNGG